MCLSIKWRFNFQFFRKYHEMAYLSWKPDYWTQVMNVTVSEWKSKFVLFFFFQHSKTEIAVRFRFYQQESTIVCYISVFFWHVCVSSIVL